MQVIEKTINQNDKYNLSSYESTGLYLVADIELSYKEYFFVNHIEGWVVYIGKYEDLSHLFIENQSESPKLNIIESSGQLTESFVLELVKILTK